MVEVTVYNFRGEVTRGSTASTLLPWINCSEESHLPCPTDTRAVLWRCRMEPA